MLGEERPGEAQRGRRLELVLLHRLGEDVLHLFLRHRVHLDLEVLRQPERLDLQILPLADEVVDFADGSERHLLSCLLGQVAELVLADGEEALVVQDQVKSSLRLQRVIRALSQRLLILLDLDL